MCLTRISRMVDKPVALIQDGWKNHAPYFSYLLPDGTSAVVFDKWLKANQITIVADDGTRYTTGFHVYIDEEDKPLGATRRVFVRNITYLGRQEKYKCAIADEIYIPSDPNGWPSKPEKKKNQKRRRNQ